MLSLLLIAALIGHRSDSLMAPGVSHDLARYRAAHIRNVRYDIDLDVTAREQASGHVRIAFTREAGGDVYIDFRGTSFDNVHVNGRDMPAVEYNRAHMRFEAEMLRDGANTIDVDFVSPVARAGASIIRFTDDTDKQDYLYTLLVPSDANLLFPCFDQPDLKAVFTLTMTVPSADWDVLSNGAKKAVIPLSNGKGFQHAFRPTRPIPTYLFAFAAGPWARVRVPGVNTTLWVRASRSKEVDADTLIALNQRAKQWLASYFGVPYPWGTVSSSRDPGELHGAKDLDFLLAPAFPFGGMEHPGAIFYNEESFIWREPPTLPQRIGRRATISHEVAHQWFGDYTTMRWFDDLWMKEGFATYMAAKMQAATGDSTAWLTFYLANKPSAYAVDVTTGTTPVWQELGNLDQAKSNYGAIVYNKAPGVLKQLNHLVGEQAFRQGVHDFLVTHPFGNGTWQELLASVGKAARRDLTTWGRAYFTRPGMPIIEQQVELANGRIKRLLLIQRPAQPGVSGAGVWPMKIDVRVEYGGASPVMLPVELRAETTEVLGARGLPTPRFVYANANDFGYGLIILDAHSRTFLVTPMSSDSATGVRGSPAERGAHVGIRSVRDRFLRAMLWGSLWDLVRDTRMDPRNYVYAALDALPDESDEQIAARVIARVGRAIDDYLVPTARASEEAMYAYDTTLQRVQELFLQRASDPSLSYGLRKSYLDGFIAVARTTGTLGRVDQWLDGDTAAGMPLRQPTRWQLVTTLIARGAPTGPARLAMETARDTTTGGKRRAFIAGAAFATSGTKHTYFTRYFADTTLNEEWVTASLGAFNASGQDTLTIDYLRPALDSLPFVQRNRRIFFLGSWMNAFIGGQSSRRALDIVDAFLREHADLPRDLRLKVLQTRDDLERTVRIRDAFVR
ncbi:MAG TPA: M1 family aminopeptidase [Gemmatimonadaceae bacterium]|nr:M1 family aminopeptidase [Gemmatimonadaceae bacterium]